MPKVVNKVVTVNVKTSNHIYSDKGSAKGYFINGIESPRLNLLSDVTYRFDQSDISNLGHQILFYKDSEKLTPFKSNVINNGIAGSEGAYTEITLPASTSIKLFYQCKNHAFMGNSLQKINSSYVSGDVVSTNETFGVWSKYIDVYGLRIFCLGSFSRMPAVDDEFIKKTAETVKLMMNPSGELIDKQAQENAIKYMKSKSTIQRVGINTFGAYQNPSLNDAPKGYDEINNLYNSVDFIWKLNDSPIQRNQITQQLEHLLHTFTDFALPGAFPSQFNLIEGKGMLWDAAKEAIDNGVYNDKDYIKFKGDNHEIYSDLYKSMVMREYLFCLTYSMWGYITKYTQDGSLDGEWSDNYLTSDSIKEANPLGYDLYTNYITKVITKPESYRLEEIYKDNHEGVSGYQSDTDTISIDETIISSNTNKNNKQFRGSSLNYNFINKGDNNYEILPKNNFDEITGQLVQKKYFSEKDIINSNDLESFALQFTDKKLDLIDDVKGVFDQVTGLNTDSGRMFRLYNAAFRRFPDSSGLKYWIDQFSSGANDIRTVSSSFLVSDEFKLRYGENISDNQYVKTLYINVLNRELDQSGYDYWVGNLSNDIEQRHEVLLGFAESAENKALFTEMTGFG
ncbi:DUF4214 domain-containing protein [Prochlorococcus sp. MIT 0801]|uniref:DUF4214 domain-containing protein n=1 Tax=Prochlorococcus sp. MIT 0801 TaxID=1501269 RepID=UPI0004F89A69|nr:DUF4214 domain-containing protein [Prochlorococcus sp. MIT 0801]AIQ97731.1 hypothetical protein EW15_1639 [Prochlorococcus sp. MIT 0801]